VNMNGAAMGGKDKPRRRVWVRKVRTRLTGFLLLRLWKYHGLTWFCSASRTLSRVWYIIAATIAELNLVQLNGGGTCGGHQAVDHSRHVTWVLLVVRPRAQHRPCIRLGRYKADFVDVSHLLSHKFGWR